MFKNINKNSNGFTVVELLVATAVFSVVLMICCTALLQVTRTYYKGITITNTQEAARSIMDEVAGAVELSSGSISGPLTASGTTVYCVGNNRYSVRLGQLLDEASTSSHAFMADRLDQPGGQLGCSQTDLVGFTGLAGTPRELLYPRMRVSKFSITPKADNLYEINIKLVRGEDDILTNPNSANANCATFKAGTQYCAVIELTTVVQKRVVQ